MIIKFLNELSNNPMKLFEIADFLKQTPIKAMEIINKINSFENGLIIWRDGYYQLTHDINFLSKKTITHGIQKNNLEYNVIVLDEINSTNSYALNHINNFAKPTVIACELQTAGRGRFGKKWNSRIANDITISVIYQIPINIMDLSVLPVLVAVALNRLLKKYNIVNSIKWPNDIYCESQKISGILVENILRNNVNNIIIGIGLNNIKQLERNQVIVDIINELEILKSEYETDGAQLIFQEWLNNCMHYNKQVTVSKNGNIIMSGIHCGVGKNGEIIICNDNEQTIFNSSLYSLNLRPC